MTQTSKKLETPRQAQERRFIAWVEARDDDWWEDQERISIWDFRIMQDFFKEELQSLFQEIREEVIGNVVTNDPKDKPFLEIINDLQRKALKSIEEKWI